LLGLGLDEFSMNSPSIPKAKEIIRHIDTTYAKTIAEKAMFCETAHEVETLVRESIYC
jgi:phosphoenolpyruvate-protein kinase (PTS system EI component)